MKLVIRLSAMEQRPSWEASSRPTSQEILRLVWNPEGSLPYSEEPATGSYPEPHVSSPYVTTLFP
jgi:hypothetical protein